jgi:hypothetical protein
MQHSTLVLSLEKAAFQSIRTQLLLLQKKSPDLQNELLQNESDDLYDNELTAVRFEHFALTLLNHMNNLGKIERKLVGNHLYTQTTSFYLQMSSIIAVFDSVDLDCRGVITYNDFVDFCLRLGRLLLKPSIRNSFSTYLQFEGNKGSLYPSHKIRYFPALNSLFVLDSDTPRVRMYKKDGKCLDKVNPISEAKRLLRVQAMNKTYYEKANYEKEFSALKLVERDFDEAKGQILDCCYIDHLKQVIFSCTNSYLFYMDASVGFKETVVTTKRDEAYHVQHYTKTNYPLYGLYYCSTLDLLVGYPGEGSEHSFEIYDPNTRALKFQIMKHETKVLAICEVILDKAHPTKDHYFVSTSMDKKVIMWPTAPMSTMVSTSTKRLLRVADIIDYELRGHNHAIHSLAYAPHNEILFGCGFDYEVVAWDPFSKDVCMKFVGHFKSLHAVQVAYVPDEKLLSLDESGVLKVWNINKDLGVYGNQESSVTLQCSQPVNIKDFIVTYEKGRGIAILAEKVYYLNSETDVVDEIKPVYNGLGFCPTSGRAFCVYRSTINLFDICNSKRMKKISFLDPDRISSTDEIISTSEDMKMDAPKKPSSNPFDTSNKKKNAEEDEKALKYFGFIDVKDTITAVTMDCRGKKVFLGTRDGRILLFDSYTFGLVKQLTNELEDEAFRQQGSVIGLHYVDRDELVVAAYDNGAVKVCSGCLRSAVEIVPEEKVVSKPGIGSSSSHIVGDASNFYGYHGGKAPPQHHLLRETDLGFIQDHSICSLSVSSDHNLIAILSKTGLIFVYDYLTMDFLVCLSMEDEGHISQVTSPSAAAGSSKVPSDSNKNIQFLFIEFLPSVPVLLVVDSTHRITAWGVKGMGNRFLLSWNVYDDVVYNNNKEANTFYSGMDFNGADPVSMGIPSFANQYNPTISCMKSYSFLKTPDVSFITSLSAIISDTTLNNDHNSDLASVVSGKKKASFHSTVAAATAARKTQVHVAEPSSDQKWILLLATEDGIMLTQNLTALLEKCGAMEYLGKYDAHYPVYNKIKPKRYKCSLVHDYHTDYARSKLSDVWENKLLHPLKRHSSINENPLVESLLQKESGLPPAPAGSFLASTGPPARRQSVSVDQLAASSQSFSASVADGSGPVGSIANITTMFDAVPKLTKQATNRKGLKNFQRLMKKFKLDERKMNYVEGLWTWHMFTHHPIRSLSFYTPFLDYSIHDLTSSMFSAGHSTAPHGHSKTHGPHRVSTHISYENNCINNRLPLLAVLGDNGNIRLCTFTGVYLGQNYDDEGNTVSEESDPYGYNKSDEAGDPNQVEDDLIALDTKTIKKSMFDEILSSRDKSTTFVTVLEETEDDAAAMNLKGKALFEHRKKHQNNENFSTAPKVYVLNERTTKVVTKRLTVVPKHSVVATATAAGGGSSNLISLLKETQPSFQNPMITSTRIMQSFINFNNQIQNEMNLYENYSIENMKLFRKKYNSFAWNFPVIKISLPIQLNKKDTDNFFPVQDSFITQTYVQYKFYLKIILRLLPVLQNDINYLYLDKIGYFDHHHQRQQLQQLQQQQQQYSHPKFPTHQQAPKLYRKISNYSSRYRSTENLLKGIDTYLTKAKALHDENYELITGKKPKSKKGAPGSQSGSPAPSRPSSAFKPPVTAESMLNNEVEVKTKEIENILLFNSTNQLDPSKSKYDHDYQENKKNEQLLKYIISGLTEHEIMMANSLQKKTMEKQSRHNLNNLIDYIQENTYFDDDLKQAKSSACHFSNYEKEKFRKQQNAPDMNNDYFFSQKLKEFKISPEQFQNIRKGVKWRPTSSLKKEQSITSQVLVPLEASVSEPVLAQLPANSTSVSEDQNKIILSSLHEANQGLNLAFEETIPNDDLDEGEEKDNIDDIIDQKMSLFKENKLNQFHQGSKEEQEQEKQSRPSTAPPAFTRPRVNSPLLPNTAIQNVKPFTRSPSPTTNTRPSSPLLPNNRDESALRPHSANDIFLHTSLPPAMELSATTKKQIQKLDHIIDNLDAISLTGIQCENSQTFPMVLTMDEIIEKANERNVLTSSIRPLSATHEAPSHLTMFIEHRPLGVAELAATFRDENEQSNKDKFLSSRPLSPLGDLFIDTKASESHESPNRLLEITRKYEEAILNSKIYSNSFHLYDPLNSRRSTEKEKYTKKLRRKLYLSRHRDQYLDEDHGHANRGGGGSSSSQQPSTNFIQKVCMEDFVDMEKEMKIQEKKRLYVQAAAAGEKTNYGFYRITDIFQFMALTDLLTVVDQATINQYLIPNSNPLTSMPPGTAGTPMNKSSTPLYHHPTPTAHLTTNTAATTTTVTGTPSASSDRKAKEKEKEDHRKRLFYFNESGQDFSRIVNHQPFYFVDELLIILNEFYDHESNLLIKDLLFYRNESPKLPLISLFHLIEIFFSLTKSISFHLRVFMFISGTSLIYDLFTMAIPPKQFNRISKSKYHGSEEEGEPEDHRGQLEKEGNNEVINTARNTNNNNQEEEGGNFPFNGEQTPQGNLYSKAGLKHRLASAPRIPFSPANKKGTSVLSSPNTPKNTNPPTFESNDVTNSNNNEPGSRRMSKMKSQIQQTIQNDQKINRRASAGNIPKKSSSRMAKIDSSVSLKLKSVDEDDEEEEEVHPYEEQKDQTQNNIAKTAEEKTSEAIIHSPTSSPAKSAVSTTSARKSSTTPGRKASVNFNLKNNNNNNANHHQTFNVENMPRGLALKHVLLIAPTVGKYIVKPHPTRGFRLWIIKRQVSSVVSLLRMEILILFFFL